MRTGIGILAIFFAVFVGVMILGGVFKGVWEGVSVIPRWLWFVGFVIFIVIWAINQKTTTSDQKPTTIGGRSPKPELEREKAKDGKPLSDQERFRLSVRNMRSPVKILAIGIGSADTTSAVVSPVFENGIHMVNELGLPMGKIVLYQEIRTSISTTTRIAEIKGTINELEKVAQEKGWHADSLINGTIIEVETFHPMCGGHKPITHPESGAVKGITYFDEFYPLYSHMEFSENEEAQDRKFQIEELLEKQGSINYQ
jgi:hypothetical protein